MRHFFILFSLLVIVVFACKTGSKEEPKLPHPDFYALYAWAGDYVEYAEDVHRTGIRWLRIGGWEDVQNREKALLVAARNNAHLIPTLGLNKTGHGHSLPLDEALSQWRKEVRTSARAYAPGGSFWQQHPEVQPQPVRYWEIWNEPNIGFLNPGKTGLTRPKFYARLLKAAIEEIRQVDKGAYIIAHNTSGGVDKGWLPPDSLHPKRGYHGWRIFIRETNELVDHTLYEAVGTHPYSQPKGPEDGLMIRGIEMTRELPGMKDKPLWFTEVGYPIEYPHHVNVRDERQQACFIVRQFAIAAAHGVVQSQIMYIVDIIYSGDGSRRSFGFYTEPGKWREQATATKVMMDLIPDPRVGPEPLSEGTEAIYAYRFKGPDGSPVVMAWYNGEGTIVWSLALDTKNAVMVDMLGNQVNEIEVKEGKLTVVLSEAPVYIVNMSLEDTRKTLGK